MFLIVNGGIEIPTKLVCINTHLGKKRATLEKLRKIEGVGEIYLLSSGYWDIIAKVSAKDVFEFHEIIQKIKKIKTLYPLSVYLMEVETIYTS